MLTMRRASVTIPPTKQESCRRGAHVTTLDTVITEFLKHKEQVRGRAPKTIETYRATCRWFREYVSAQKGHAYAKHFTRDMIEAWVAAMFERGVSRVSIINRLAVLRELGKFGVRQRVWTADPFLEIEAMRTPHRLPKPFTARERDALMALDLPPEDRALRAILYYAGLRVQEVTQLLVKHYEPRMEWPDGRRTFARLTVINGKGNKQRTVTLHHDAADALEWFLGNKPKDDARPASFIFTHHDGEPWHTKMIQRRVGTWGTKAGVAPCHPHRFRHTFATNLLEAGNGVMVARDMLGHASVATTQMYTAVVDAQKDAAAASLPSFVLRQHSGTPEKVAPAPSAPLGNTAK